MLGERGLPSRPGSYARTAACGAFLPLQADIGGTRRAVGERRRDSVQAGGQALRAPVEVVRRAIPSKGGIAARRRGRQGIRRQGRGARSEVYGSTETRAPCLLDEGAGGVGEDELHRDRLAGLEPVRAGARAAVLERLVEPVPREHDPEAGRAGIASVV